MLGRTPFTTQVPIPAPEPGQAQAFQFTFVLPGYEAVTLTASPVNGTITLNAVMRPAGSGDTPPDTAEAAPDEGGGGGGGSGRFTLRGSGGGRIYDNHTTTSSIRVSRDCEIDSLSIDLNGSHTFNSDLTVTLRGPDGTTYPIQRRDRRSPFRTHRVRRAHGHRSAGSWTASIADTVRADSGQFTSWSMTVDCR